MPEDEREAMFFGGLFAYDTVAGFEDLPETEQGNRCPDYCFYRRNPAGDRPSEKYTRIRASLFTPSVSEKNRLAQRIAQLQQQMSEAPPALPVQRVEKMTCEVSQTDDQYGAVVRQMQKRFVPGRFSVWCRPVAFHCPARRRWRLTMC